MDENTINNVTTVEGTETTPEETPAQETPQENPVRLLRQQYETTKSDLDKSNALLQRIARNRGISVEELGDVIQKEEDKRQADSNNIPIEVQQRIRTQEEKIKNLEMQNLRNDFEARAGRLRNEYQLNDQQIIGFAQKAESLGLNVFTPGLDLVTIYRAMNYDSLVSNLRSSIRQEVLEELKNSGNANSLNNIPGTQQPNENTGNSNMSEADFIKALFG